jgi:hypothetical protein
MMDRWYLLAGDRDIEWSWISGNMPSGAGLALEVGPGESNIALVAVRRGYKVLAVDLKPVHWKFTHPRIEFAVKDILSVKLSQNSLDLVILCSTVEHIGLAGRYGVSEGIPEGDLQLMGRLRVALKPSGLLLLTIPVGVDSVFHPLHRVYGESRLPLLLDGFEIEREEFWCKESGLWRLTTRKRALNYEPKASSWNSARSIYALGCFSLRKR